MWIFVAYELLPTWRQRAKDMRKRARNGGLETKPAVVREDRGFRHFGRDLRAGQIESLLEDSDRIDAIGEDLRRTVHAHRGDPDSAGEARSAQAAKLGCPASGYGRINQWCGALDHELEGAASASGQSTGATSRRSCGPFRRWTFRGRRVGEFRRIHARTDRGGDSGHGEDVR